MPRETSEDGARRRARVGFWVGLALAAGVMLAPAPAGLSAAGWRTAAVGLLMAVWWMSEALPIPVTALLPLALFPLAGIAPLEATASPYAHPLIFLFLGGFLLALALERWRLHRRLALAVVLRLGTRPVRLIAGFMVASAFLSMWISNTATTLLMLPIGLSLVELVEPEEGSARGGNFAICLMLGIAYACSLGGMATLIGTPTNALLAAFSADAFGREIAFVDWLLVGLPLVVVGLPLTLWVLTRWVYPVRLTAVEGGRFFIARELVRLGPVSRPERRVAAIFAFTAAAWICRPLLARWLPGLSDTGVSMLAGLALFVVPAGEGEGRRSLLDWGAARRLPWGVLLLFGGGLSLAAAIRDTGLAAWIGGHMEGLAGLPSPLVVLAVCAVIVLLTELTSNTATTAAFLPILASLAAALGLEPLTLLIPAALAASCAFMLPVATPPNAIVYGSDLVTVPQMARAGAWLNLLFVVLVGLGVAALVPIVF